EECNRLMLQPMPLQCAKWLHHFLRMWETNGGENASIVSRKVIFRVNVRAQKYGNGVITSRKTVITLQNVERPSGFGLSALLIGRSSTTHQGIQVLLGVIDADYTGVVKIMVQILIPPVFIPKGSKIAQLVLCKACVPNAGEGNRGTGGFRSTGE
uniref:dUTPase-like domain-containing protein n=1 Tax=Otus sunia TaxID=257818 RepID=A0A8C8B4C3_9STRI